MLLLDIIYKSENLLPGNLGKAFLLSALLLSVFSFFLYAFQKDESKKAIFARIAYILHWILIVGAGIALFHLISNHEYEYEYVWKHVSNNLELKYLISALWAGQAGSFWLWVFMQGAVGLALLFTSRKWENYVMPVVSLAQSILLTMIVGIKVFGAQIGQSPFKLLRNGDVNAEADFFQNPDYLSFIGDGNGINPLLENYWMVIHPPILFLGYALAIAPFAYAIAALWKKNFNTWQKPAFIWNASTVLVLGIGIILGGAWAYESLTFGGFWAWDPVENASLIPWLVALASLHMLIINRKRKHSYLMTFVLSALSYVMVVYASYLTRSGVLGETSVHAFGNNGLSLQLVVMLLASVAVMLYFILSRYKKLPEPKKDNIVSREFWMHLGVIVLLLSAFQVFATTSVPVFNAILNTNIAPPQDVVAYYNKWQMPFAIIIMLIIAVSLVLKYGKNNIMQFTKSILAPLAITIALFVAQVFIFEISEFGLLLFLLFTNLVLASSLYYLVKNKFNLHFLANFLSHGGFAIFMIGVIVAFSQSEIISKNTSKYNLGDQISNKENQVIFKNEIIDLGPYHVEYSSYQRKDNHLYYNLNFYTVEEGDTVKEFTLRPDINVNRKMGNVYNPDTYSSFSKDVFTFISYADIDADLNKQEFKSVIEKEIKTKDTIEMPDMEMVVDSIWLANTKGVKDFSNIEIYANITMIKEGEKLDELQIGYFVKEGKLYRKDAIFDDRIKFSFEKLSEKPGHLTLGVYEKRMDFIVVKSTIFPYISILWIGVIIMFSGLFVSIIKSIVSRQ